MNIESPCKNMSLTLKSHYIFTRSPCIFLDHPGPYVKCKHYWSPCKFFVDPPVKTWSWIFWKWQETCFDCMMLCLNRFSTNSLFDPPPHLQAIFLFPEIQNVYSNHIIFYVHCTLYTYTTKNHNNLNYF